MGGGGGGEVLSSHFVSVYGGGVCYSSHFVCAYREAGYRLGAFEYTD